MLRCALAGYVLGVSYPMIMGRITLFSSFFVRGTGAYFMRSWITRLTVLSPWIITTFFAFLSGIWSGPVASAATLWRCSFSTRRLTRK